VHILNLVSIYMKVNMELVLKKKKADAFVMAMDDLGEKFNNKYIDGNIEDFVNLNVINNKPELVFIKPIPEMVRTACYLVFINTLL